LTDTIFCPNCGERISARARFCPACGARQDEFRVGQSGTGSWTSGGPGAPPPPPPPPPPASPRRDEAPPREPAARDEPPPRDTAPPAAAPPRDTSPPADAPPRDPAPRGERRDDTPSPPAAATPAAPDAPRAATTPPRDTPRPADVPARDPSRPADAPSRDTAPRGERRDDTPSPPAGDAARRNAPRAAGAPRDPSPRDSPPRDGVDLGKPRRDPPVGELTGALRQRLAVPGVVAACIAGAVSAGVVLAAGLLIAIITPDASILGAVGVDASLVTETFRQAVGTQLTAMVDPGLLINDSRRIHPLLLLAIPLTALILTTRWQLERTEGAPALARIGWAMAVAIPFALLMLLFALLGGDSELTNIAPSAGSAFALGLLWGAIGGLIGAVTKLPRADLERRLPRTLVRATLATLRPLAVVVVTCTVVALVGWLIQVGRDAGGIRLDRSAATALIEEASFAAENGINLTALAAGARFRADANGPIGLPFPVADANSVPGDGGLFRIFSYDDALPTYVLVPAIVFLMGLVALGALYAGFAAARAAAARTLGTGAAWGALTGPAWALTMALLVVLAGGLFRGDADDASVFGIFLLGGGLLGAAGGALAVSAQE